VASADDVAYAVISSLGPMPAMKLEKLVYYAQVWHLARHGVPLFTEEIQAWRQGPVVPALYAQHRGQFTVQAWSSGDARGLSAEQAATVAWVVEKYGGFTAESLSRMTHSEAPWRVARVGLGPGEPSRAPIDHRQMAAFYGRQQADPETAVQHAVASADLEGVELDERSQETLRDITTGLISVEDAVAAEVARISRG
jgi:uncharacterized phage-associated protein